MQPLTIRHKYYHGFTCHNRYVILARKRSSSVDIWCRKRRKLVKKQTFQDGIFRIEFHVVGNIIFLSKHSASLDLWFVDLTNGTYVDLTSKIGSAVDIMQLSNGNLLIKDSEEKLHCHMVPSL